MFSFLQKGSFFILDGTKSESLVNSVRASSEAVIFRKVLQTLIIKCFGAFLEILGCTLWASAEKGIEADFSHSLLCSGSDTGDNISVSPS